MPRADEFVQAADVVITVVAAISAALPGQALRGVAARRPARRPLDEVHLIRDELDKLIEAFLVELVPRDDSAAERQTFVLVVWLAPTGCADTGARPQKAGASSPAWRTTASRPKHQ
jgi:hypothetical protein